MGNTEDYKCILDISSLDLVVNRYLQEIAEEEKRLKFLENKKLDKISQLSDHKENLLILKKDTSVFEKELYEVDSRISKNKKSISDAVNNQQLEIFEKTLLKLEDEKLELEEKILNLMMEIEDTETLIKNCNIFIDGVTSTIEEILKEVDLVKTKNNDEINLLEAQVDGLVQSISIQMKNTFLSVRKKFRFDSPVVKLIQLSCSKCRFTMSRSDCDDIETRGNYILCNGCGRIVISSRHF